MVAVNSDPESKSSGTPPSQCHASVPDSSECDRSRCVHELFERQAAQKGGAVAIVMPEVCLNYAELNERANRIARRLTALGAGPGTRIGVCLPRSPEMVIAMLGVLKAGAAYVPLELEYPPDRLQLMMADAGLSALVIGPVPPAGIDFARLPLVKAEEESLGNSVNFEASCGLVDPDAAAYLMYTSGSTGKPKGVVVPHRGITRLVCATDFVDITAEDVFLQLAPVSFDASTFEIWGALLNGARLALMPPGRASLAEIGEAIRREKVSILWLTGGLFNLMVDERPEDLRPLKQLLIGGEVLSVPHVEKALAVLENTRLINGYGPTENTTFTCCHRIRKGENFSRGVPVGRPIRGTSVKIVDSQLRPVAPGEEGELLAGGKGVALGYWNRPDLTAERFLFDPAAPGAAPQYYRTGDQVRMREDGVIEFLGRRDGQIKLRGFRIELGEIESAIRGHESVRDCAVKVVSWANGQQVLAAYVVPKVLGRTTQQDLAGHLQKLLPAYMWPGVWMFLEQLPLNPNGKLDRAALPDPLPGDIAGDAELPASELERVIGETWRAVLGGRNVGLEVTFFDAGGTSLQVTQLHERLSREHGIRLPLTALFQFPSVRSLARHLAGTSPAPEMPSATEARQRGSAQRQALNRFRKSPIQNP